MAGSTRSARAASSGAMHASDSTGSATRSRQPTAAPSKPHWHSAYRRRRQRKMQRSNVRMTKACSVSVAHRDDDLFDNVGDHGLGLGYCEAGRQVPGTA